MAVLVSLNFFYYIYVFICVSGVHLRRSEDSFLELILSFFYVGSRDQTPVSVLATAASTCWATMQP